MSYVDAEHDYLFWASFDEHGAHYARGFIYAAVVQGVL